MEAVNNAKILRYRIIKSDIFIAKKLPDNFKLKIQFQSRIKAPTKSDDKTALLEFILTVTIPDSDNLKIRLESEFIFEFDAIPDNYNDISEELCVPQAYEKISDILDHMLGLMGFNGLHLFQQTNANEKEIQGS